MIKNYSRYAQGSLDPYRLVNVRIYSNLNELMSNYFYSEGEIEIEDIDVIGGVFEGGEIKEFTVEEMTESIVEAGVWGYVDSENIIHMWYSEDIDELTMIQFFAHEFAHLTESDEKEEILDELLLDEIRAEQFSDAATFAFNMTKELLELKIQRLR